MQSILIIDDDVHIGDMLTEVLEQAGYAFSKTSSVTL